MSLLRSSSRTGGELELLEAFQRLSPHREIKSRPNSGLPTACPSWTARATGVVLEAWSGIASYK
jgi:hypothetical protein